MRYTILLLSFLLLSVHVPAQEKKLTLEDAVLRERTTLAPKQIFQLQWIPGTIELSYVDKRESGDVVVKANALKSGVVDLVSFSGLNAMLKAAGADTLSKMPVLKWKDAETIHFEADKKTWLYSVNGAKLILSDSSTLPESAEVVEKSSKGEIAYVQDNNIWLEQNHQRKQITSDGSYDLVYGKSVHREEFGITKGLFWSPRSSRLAFYRMDQSMVTDYPIVDFSEIPAKNTPVKYPFAGGKSHQVTVGIYDVSSGKTIYLKTGEPLEQYLTNVAWSPDEESVYIAVLNREQNHMRLNQYNAVTGDFIKTLFEEVDAKYTEPMHPIEFVNENGSLFVWQSRRDGWNHLYLYDNNGKLVRQLTKGEWEVTAFNGFDAKGKRGYFLATSNTGINRDFYSVEIASGKLTKISSGDGVHKCIGNDDKTLFADVYSSLNVPGISQIVNGEGKIQRQLLVADNPLKDYAVAKTRLFTIKAEDGTPLWCRMLVPDDFDSTKRYPTIVYLYGGPNVQLITNTWLGGANLWFHYLTQQGYIVFTLENRGTACRGKAFEQVTYRKLGDVEMTDQITGVNYLRKLSYIDANRLGINGWSYGGFMTTSLMTRYPGIFKVAVAGGPVIDWSAYEVMYTERYMDTPDENAGGYRISNLLNYVDQLNGKLLLIHGTSDNTVVWQHSLMYLKKAVSKGVQVDYFVYPGHEHNVRGKDRVHLNEKITRYFNDYLK